MNKKQKHSRNKIEDIEGKFEMGNSTSACDCTGLIQVEPMDDYQLESYMAVYDFGPYNIDK